MKTTDNQHELFDLVNEADEVIGTVTRGQAHSDNSLIHRGIWVLVFNSRGELFLQKRSLTKDLNPGFWSISVGGHVSSGQSYFEAAEREFQEELGVVAPQLRELGTIMYKTDEETEIDRVFRARHDGPFMLQPEEIETGAFFPLTELEAKIKNGHIHISIPALGALATFCEIDPGRDDLATYIVRTTKT